MTSSAPSPEYFGVSRVTGRNFRSTVTVTRPADTTAYAAGDVIGTSTSAIQTLGGIGPTGGFVLLQSLSLAFSDASVPAGMAGFRVHFYHGSPGAVVDNAAFDLTAADQVTYSGFVDLPTPSDFGTLLYCQTDAPGRMIKLVTGSTSLFTEIQTLGAYTPASASTIELRVLAIEMGL